MRKYCIDWEEENAKDNGFLNDDILHGVLIDDRTIDSRLKNRYNFNAIITDYNVIKFGANTYLVLEISPRRHSAKSILELKIDNNAFNKIITEKIEVPVIVNASKGIVKVFIKIANLNCNNKYQMEIKYKDDVEDNYNVIKCEFLAQEGKININKNSDFLIEYGFIDFTGSVGDTSYHKIDVEPYQKEDGTWTSDVVANPEQYLKSDLDWYYSDERLVDYIETHQLLPQEKIDAIRAANYEDIFSPEYRLKSAIKFIPIALIIIIFLVLLIKKIKNKIRK